MAFVFPYEEPESMFCTKCGLQLEDRDRFCFECGTQTGTRSVVSAT